MTLAAQIYEYPYNLMYIPVPNKHQATNILIYDIPKNMQFNLFRQPLEEGEQIQQILFEQEYQADTKTRLYNNMSLVQNNYDVLPRELKNFLLVETMKSSISERYLWLGDKWGFTMRRVAKLQPNAQWHLDARNDMIRILTPTKEGSFVIEQLDWQ